MQNKIMWGLIFAVVIATVVLSIITFRTQGQTQDPKQDEILKKIQDDLGQFPVVEYDSPELRNIAEREKRRLKSKRYDNTQLVISSNPRPETSGMAVFDESTPPPAIPIDESEVVIIGEALNAEAHLSNNKTSVYSEFTIRVEEVLKSNQSHKITQNSSITIDRPGGFVRYPNGQKLLYRVAGKDLPRVGRRYVLFLTNAGQSPNFNILTGYELRSGKVYPLDMTSRFQKFKGMDETNFITTIREAVSQPSQKVSKQ